MKAPESRSQLLLAIPCSSLSELKEVLGRKNVLHVFAPLKYIAGRETRENEPQTHLQMGMMLISTPESCGEEFIPQNMRNDQIGCK